MMMMMMMMRQMTKRSPTRTAMDWSSYAEVMTTTFVVERNDFLR